MTDEKNNGLAGATKDEPVAPVVNDGSLDVKPEDLTETGKSISEDELEMLNDVRSQVHEQAAALTATQNVLNRMIQRLGQKHKLGERKVIGDDGKIMEISEEAFQKLRLQQMMARR